MSDEIDGYGSETISIYECNKDKYLYYVHQYSRNGNISDSKATVRVYLYNNGKEETSYIFTVPQDCEGKYWSVFSYYPNGDKEGKKIVPINSLSFYEPLE